MAKKKPITTNAIRMIAAAKLPYELLEYEVSGGVGEHFGEQIAESIGMPKEQFFKTLVAKGERTGIMVMCVPCNCEVDLKKIAKAAGDKKVEMIHVKDLLSLTGYIRGSVSPIGMKKKYPTYIHDSALKLDKMIISGGVCGAAVLMTPQDVQKMTDCEFADIV